MSDFKVIHIESADEDKPIPIKCFFIPSPTFSWLIVGATKSGKSNLIKNLLLNKAFLKNIFHKHHIFLFCGTARLNRDFEGLVEKENVYEDFDTEIIRKLMKEQEENIEEYGRKNTPHILLIFDDLAYGGALHSDTSLLNKLCMNGRHYKISIIVTTQALKLVSPKTRANATLVSMFASNENELEKFMNDYMSHRIKRRIEDLVYDHLDQKYNFVTFIKSNPASMKFIKNLEEPF
jgi:hypothetical protein